MYSFFNTESEKNGFSLGYCNAMREILDQDYEAIHGRRTNSKVKHLFSLGSLVNQTSSRMECIRSLWCLAVSWGRNPSPEV